MSDGVGCMAVDIGSSAANIHMAMAVRQQD